MSSTILLQKHRCGCVTNWYTSLHDTIKRIDKSNSYKHRTRSSFLNNKLPKRWSRLFVRQWLKAVPCKNLRLRINSSELRFYCGLMPIFLYPILARRVNHQITSSVDLVFSNRMGFTPGSLFVLRSFCVAVVESASTSNSGASGSRVVIFSKKLPELGQDLLVVCFCGKIPFQCAN